MKFKKEALLGFLFKLGANDVFVLNKCVNKSKLFLLLTEIARLFSNLALWCTIGRSERKQRKKT
ncbi:hypothetical protein GCM10026987_25660 [Belliella aquatica]|uniref:Uncharacterized protein n=1 Tax=Belliella aquatica TaxID=1323734 RepID=A0ABQ1N2I3_9BACT|nr:hypothetical protein GCM10010993_30230 [Belliella aquatica]